MLKLLKYLPLAGLFQNVSAEVKAAGLAKRPLYLQRTFIGAVLALASGALAIGSGVTVNASDMTILTDGVTQIAAVAGTVYGAALSVYGVVAKLINAVKGKQVA